MPTYQGTASRSGFTPDPGEFDAPVSLLRRSSDEAVDSSSVNAIWNPIGGVERIVNDRLQTRQSVAAAVQYSSSIEDLDTGWWVERDGQKYDIESVLEPWGNKGGFELRLVGTF